LIFHQIFEGHLVHPTNYLLGIDTQLILAVHEECLFGHQTILDQAPLKLIQDTSLLFTMEPTSFGLAVAGLPGVFTACTDCFDMIQLGRNFGKDYEKCLLRLEVSKARLGRWGQSVGLADGYIPRDGFNASDAEKETAMRLLSSILETFQDVDKKAKRYKPKTSESVMLDTSEDDKALIGGFQRLHMSMRENAAARQSQTTLRSKVVWAIYRKKDFDRMVEDIGEFVDSLTSLFPAAIPRQHELVASEVASIRNLRDLQILGDISGQDDPMLQDAVKHEMGMQGSIFNHLRAEGSSQLHVGDDVAYGVEGRSHIYNGGSSTDNANAHFGNVYRGKDNYGGRGPV
jgi:Prion-inhibition and propagation